MGRSTGRRRDERQAQLPQVHAKQKLEIVLAGLRGEGTVKDLCREHEISENLYYSWRDHLIEAAGERFAGKAERQSDKELRKRIAELERTLGRKTTSSRSRENCYGIGIDGARRPVP